MPLMCPERLEFSKLKTPRGHGDVLVEPAPSLLIRAAESNANALDTCDRRILDVPLREWRRRERTARFGVDHDALVFMCGHQPSFIHPGVWAKHIVARRLAQCAGGRAVNLVVDNDAPHTRRLMVPQVLGTELLLRRIPFVDAPAGHAYELFPAWNRDRLDRFTDELRTAMADRYDRSLMPRYEDAVRKRPPVGTAEKDRAECDWVDQSVAGRKAIETSFGIDIEDLRVSHLSCEPLFSDMILHADRFVACYNGALAAYRNRHRIRGRRRPIPDLVVSPHRWELPMWAYRPGESRRRLMAGRRQGRIELTAGDQRIATLDADVREVQPGSDRLGGQLGEWRVRPRALTLTVWARLFLADLFVHGIGGAKYDRIADRLIAGYYGIDAPRMACVSATLHMDLPRYRADERAVRHLRWALRELRWNPQRYGDAGNGPEDEIRERALWVDRAKHLAVHDRLNRGARRTAFRKIREMNERLWASRGADRADLASRLSQAEKDVGRNRIAEGREYFFGLYDRRRLELLLDRLPGWRQFRV